MPVAQTVKELLASINFYLTCDENTGLAVEELKKSLTTIVGLPMSFTEGRPADLTVKIIARDQEKSSCPYPLFELLTERKTAPLTIDVPYVSNKTIFYVHRISEPALEDDELKLALQALRIIHLTCHTIGYSDHIEFASLSKDYEAQLRGDPLLAKEAVEKECLMSWRQLYVMASKLDPARKIPVFEEFPICNECDSHPTGFRLSDFDAISEMLELHRRKETTSSFKQNRYAVLYVLGKNRHGEVVLGVSPIRSRRGLGAASGMTLTELEEGLLSGFYLSVPPNLFEQTEVRMVKPGLKGLVEFGYTSSRDDEELRLSSLKMLHKLSEGHKIDDISSMSHHLGIGRIRLTIRIKWAPEVDTVVLREAAAKVRKLTGCMVVVDRKTNDQLRQTSSKILNIINSLKGNLEPGEFRKIMHNLQDILNGVGPRAIDIVDTAFVEVFILPKMCYLPISTAGHWALGQTTSRIFTVLAMPPETGQVQLVSEACQECSKNYTKGRSYEYSSHLAVLIIHELLHITAGLRDHRGECHLCMLDKPEMKPLRLTTCDRCIQEDGHFVHRNCVMSYACQLCIAARLGEIGRLNEILCETCISSTRPESDYIHTYFRRLNAIIYQDMITKIGQQRFEEANKITS